MDHDQHKGSSQNYLYSAIIKYKHIGWDLLKFDMCISYNQGTNMRAKNDIPIPLTYMWRERWGQGKKEFPHGDQ